MPPFTCTTLSPRGVSGANHHQPNSQPFTMRPWTLCGRILTKPKNFSLAKKIRPVTAPEICPASGSSYVYSYDAIGDDVAARLVVLSRLFNCNLNISQYMLIFILSYKISRNEIMHSRKFMQIVLIHPSSV